MCRLRLIYILLISVCILSGGLIFSLFADQKPLTKEEESKLYHTARPGDSAAKRLASFEKHKLMKEGSVFKNLRFRSVGPLAASGRIVDIEASSDVPYTMFVAFASGGLWKTVTDGTSWEPIFDEEASIIIGDIAVVWPEAKIIWVGTGENNSSRSSYSGTGVYKSMDGGRTWMHMGLADSHRIGRIVIDPKNPDIVYVSAIGALYTNNENRGLYKTTDGGKTWEKILYVNDRTGCIDLVMHPTDPNILWAAMWERDRRAWNFLESGPGSGLYKTTDGGRTWKKLENGLPGGWCMGRIGIDVAGEHPDTLYAFIDNQCLRPKDEPDPFQTSDSLTASRLKTMTEVQLLALDDSKLNGFLNYYGFHKDYNAGNIKSMLKSGEITIKDLLDYIGDANVNLFETRIIGPDLYRSDDGGETWYKTHKMRLDRMYYSYGYYFGQVRVHPKDPDQVYVMGVPVGKSIDGGKTFMGVMGPNVHVDMHAFWIDPKYPDRVLLGTDGGLNISYDSGKNWRKISNIPVSQFYTVAVDMAQPYNIYGGTQDNGVLTGPSTFIPGYSEPWKDILGGDGGYVQINPGDNKTVYTEYQFGFIFRKDMAGGALKPIKPRHRLKEEPLRYNWQSPIHMSRHNPDIIYFGTDRLYRSLNRGDDWEPISPDLTTNPKPQGDVPFGTITTIDESPLKFGLLYAGTDDGRVWSSSSGGDEWKEIVNGIPEKKWVTRVISSAYDEGTVYLTLNGYRDDNFEAMIYQSTDYGKIWQSIKNNLPDEPVNVIREDPVNKNILYVGTDLGLFVTLDGGKSWYALMGALPNAPVHDLVIHPRDKDIVVGTHGRSIYVLSVKNIQQLKAEVLAKPVFIFSLDPVTYNPERWEPGSIWYKPIIEPGIEIVYYLKDKGEVTVNIKDDKGNMLQSLKGTDDIGMNVVKWNYVVDKSRVKKLLTGKIDKKNFYKEADLKKQDKKLFALPGKYRIEIIQGKNSAYTELEVKPGRKIERSEPGARPKGP